MSRPRRPSVSIYDYPEDLNPFNDGGQNGQTQSSSKEPKQKFWTFGRSKKKRSNSFSIKSTWNGIFGKQKDPAVERRTTITTVSTTYQNGRNSTPVVPPRSLRDHKEFDEALGTLTRRRKYTIEGSSRYGSNLTVNGDPSRLYDGSPQDTTTSILGESTPKAPARRFGQVSPRPDSEIPPLDFENRKSKQNETCDIEERVPDQTPVPPRRFGHRSSQRLDPITLEVDEGTQKISDFSERDENENLADDYIFRRCSQDAVRRSNLSINSCISTASGISTLGRKKRRAPQPPQRREQLDSPEEQPSTRDNLELQIQEPIDIARVTEDIEKMTRQSHEIDIIVTSAPPVTSDRVLGNTEEKTGPAEASDSENKDPKSNSLPAEPIVNQENLQAKTAVENDIIPEAKTVEKQEDFEETKPSEDSTREVIEADKVEIRKEEETTLEIITDVDEESDSAEVELRKKSSKLSRSDSLSVKEEIEKLNKQIAELEANKKGNSSSESFTTFGPSNGRLTIQEGRRSFFKNMVSSNPGGVKIEIKELPREQKDIEIIRLTDAPVPVAGPRNPVKIVELHISEPIKQVPELVREVNINPLPKPRRHGSTHSLKNSPEMTDAASEKDSENSKDQIKRGDSL